MRRIGGAWIIMLLGVIWLAASSSAAAGATGSPSAVPFTPNEVAPSLPEPPPIQDAPRSELMVEAGANGASSSAELEGEADAPAVSGVSPDPATAPDTEAAPDDDEDEGIEYKGPLPVPFEGGYIQHRPHVFLIFWGSEWNGIPGTKEKLIGLYRALSGSAYAHILTQYFDYGGYFSGEVDLTSITDARVTAPPPAQPADVRAEVQAMIAAHPEWGSVSYENQYVVVTPPATPSTFPQGCGYHGWENYSYTYVPWPTAECLRGLQPWGSIQVSLSHEWAESTTDPIPVGEYFAWDAQHLQGEIADVCNTATPAEQTTVAEGIYASKLGDDYLWKANNTICVGHDAEADRFEWGTGGWSVPQPHSVNISGSINPAGEPAYYDFDFNGPGGTQNVPPRCANPTEKHYCFGYAGEAYSAVPVGATVSGLKGETAYSYRLETMGKLTEGSPTIEYYGVQNIMPGQLVQFTTPSWRPIVSGVSATPGKLSMTVKATINSQGGDTHYRIEYGPTSSYSWSYPVPDEDIGSGVSQISKTIGGIEGFIHYRIVASNEEGTTYSPDDEVYVQERPSVTAGGVTDRVGTGAKLHGVIEPHGYTGIVSSYFFEYGPTASYGSQTAEAVAGSGTSAISVSAELSGLSFGTLYHYRLVGTNWAGIRYGADGTFTPGWTPSSVRTLATGAHDSRLNSVSCRSQTFCVGVGHFGKEGGVDGELGMGELWNGNEWAVQSLPRPAEASTTEPWDVSCPSQTACEAVGWSQGPPYGQKTPMALRWEGGKWALQSPSVPQGEWAGELLGVSCSSGSSCEAVGDTEKIVSPYVHGSPIAEFWNGSEWRAQSVPAPPPAPAGEALSSLESISCVTANACTAVGIFVNWHGLGSIESAGLLAERWNGATWTMERLPMPSGTASPGRVAVSCVTASECEMVGYADTSEESEATIPFAERWNGTEWHAQSVPYPGTNFKTNLESIACTSASRCEAVGGYVATRGGPTNYIVERWNGASWTIQEPYEPEQGGFLHHVSCSASNECMAVGNDGPEVGAVRTQASGSAYFENPPASVATKAAILLEGGAVLHGTVNPDRSATEYYFEYGKTSAYGSRTPGQGAGSGTSAIEEVASITGVNAESEYHYRLVATNAGGTVYSADATFTGPRKPSVGTVSGNCGLNGCTPIGTVNPNGLATTYMFEWEREELVVNKWTCKSSTLKKKEGNAGAGLTPVSVSGSLLTGPQKYCVWLSATSAVGTTTSEKTILSVE